MSSSKDAHRPLSSLNPLRTDWETFSSSNAREYRYLCQKSEIINLIRKYFRKYLLICGHARVCC